MQILTRRRKQKKDKEHEKRMKAAVETILPLGFGRQLIVTTVQNLLQVYGGQKGWAFIEEDSYKLLVDSILEGQRPSSTNTGALGEETNTEQIDGVLVDVKLGKNKLKRVSDMEVEGCTAEMDKNCADQPCEQSEQVTSTKGQLSKSSISNGILTRKEEKFGNPNVCAEGDSTSSYKKDIGLSSASMTKGVPFYSNGVEATDIDVGQKIQDLLDGISASLKREVACQKALHAEGKESKKEKDEESNEGSEGHGKGRFCDLSIDVTTYPPSLAKLSEPDGSQRVLQENRCIQSISIMAFKHEEISLTSQVQPAKDSCLIKNSMQEHGQLVPDQVVDQTSGVWNHADRSKNASLSVLHSLSQGHTSMPLKRKPCFGWLSDDESSSERSDMEELGNEISCKDKGRGSDNMTICKRACPERYGSGRNGKNDNNIMLSNVKESSEKKSSQYDYRRSDKDKGRSPDCLVQPCGNYSEDIGNKYIGGNKYEKTKNGKSLQKIQTKSLDENETYGESSCKFSNLEMDESPGGSRLIKALCKLQSSHDGYETYTSNHISKRRGGKPLSQSNNKYTSYHEKTLPHSPEDYQRSETTRKDWKNQSQNICKQHLQGVVCCNLEDDFHKCHYVEDEKHSQKAKYIVYDKRYMTDQGYDRDKERKWVKCGKPPLPHKNKGFQDANNACSYAHGSREFGDKFHFSNKQFALSHAENRHDHDILRPYSKSIEGDKQPSRPRRKSRWDIKPDDL